MPIKRKRLHTGQRVKIIDRVSKYIDERGTLIKPKQVPVGMQLKYHWLVKLDGIEAIELFALEQLEVIE